MMSGQISAEIGHWYHPVDQKESFEVVAINFDEQSIEVQYFDGEIEEIEFSGWKTLVPIETVAPEESPSPYGVEQQDPFNEYAINEALVSINQKTN